MALVKGYFILKKNTIPAAGNKILRGKSIYTFIRQKTFFTGNTSPSTESKTVLVRNSILLPVNTTMLNRNSALATRNTTMLGRNRTLPIGNTAIFGRNSTLAARNTIILGKNSTLSGRNTALLGSNSSLSTGNTAILGRNSSILFEKLDIHFFSNPLFLVALAEGPNLPALIGYNNTLLKYSPIYSINKLIHKQIDEVDIVRISQ